MKIILKENIENLGKKGDIVKVAPGFGRNYLIPKKMALEVKPKNMKMIEIEQKALRKGLEKEMKSVQTLIERLNQVELKFTRKAGDKDSIFGSVSVTDIKEALDGLNFEIEKKKIQLDEPIKKLGHFTVSVKVFHDQKSDIKVEVLREAEEEEIPVAVKKEAPSKASETKPEAKKSPAESPEEKPSSEDTEEPKED